MQVNRREFIWIKKKKWKMATYRLTHVIYLMQKKNGQSGPEMKVKQKEMEKKQSVNVVIKQIDRDY